MPNYPYNYYNNAPYNGFNSPNMPSYQPNPYNYTPMANSTLNAPNMQPNTNVRIVDNIDVVRAADIPMDGNTYYFPKGDGTAIYTKRWLSNGDAPVLTFIPQKQQETPSPIDSTSDNVKAHFDDLNNVLTVMQDKLNSLYDKVEELSSKPKTTTAKTKTEQ